jgi:hypothetical protein
VLIASGYRKEITICKHYEENNEGKSPLEDDTESHQSNENVNECGKDIKKNQLDNMLLSMVVMLGEHRTYFESVVYSSPSVQDPKNFSSLATRVPGIGQVQQVIKRQL